MYSTTTLGNIFLSLLLSIILTFVLAFVYAFSPLIFAIVKILLSRGDGTSGIGAVAGGSSRSFPLVFLLGGPVLFLIIFYLLQRRRAKS